MPLSKNSKRPHLPATASFEHVSPVGAAVGVELTKKEKKVYGVDDPRKL